MSIKLRKLKKSDLIYFLKWWKDIELVKLTSGVHEKSDKVLSGYFLDFFKHPKDKHYMILFGAKVIGHLALTHKSETTFEMHIVIGEKKFWGKGLGTEAIKRAIKIAFGRLGYTKAYLEVRPGNVRAIKTYENCGFIKKGLKKYPKNKFQPVVLKMILSKAYYENT